MVCLGLNQVTSPATCVSRDLLSIVILFWVFCNFGSIVYHVGPQLPGTQQTC